MSDSDWIPLDREELNQAQLEEVRGVQVEVYLSPYDVPSAVRGYGEDGVFTIEFQYLSDEPLRKEPSGLLTLHIGKHSRRLYKIEIPVGELKANAVELIVSTIDEKADALGPMVASNYQLAGKIIQQQGRDILAAAGR